MTSAVAWSAGFPTPPGLLAAGSEPPVTPDADTAREWLDQELARPEYHQGPSLLDRFLDWLNDLFGTAPDLGIPRAWAALIVVAVIAAVAVAAFLIAGPVRRRAIAPTGIVLDADDERTAAQCRAAADAASAAGDWGLAVVERFRAIARSLEERAILDERPGRTAHEVALDAHARFGDPVRDDLTRAADLFDSVCYGDGVASSGDDALLRDVDRRLAATRPATTPEPVTGVPA